MSKALKGRLEELERKHTPLEPIHIIMVSYPNQPDDEAFDDYQAKRTAEGYTPKQGWEQLKKEYLASGVRPIGIEDASEPVGFITFDVVESK